MAKPATKNVSLRNSHYRPVPRQGQRTVREPLGQTVCKEPACENLAIVAAYCRLHYIKNWHRLKQKEALLKDGKFRRYVVDLIGKLPEKQIEAIRNDLSHESIFIQIIHELELRDVEDELDLGAPDIEPVEGIRSDVEDHDEGF